MKTKLTIPLWSLTGLFMAVGLYVLLHGGWPRVRPITIVRTVWQTNTVEVGESHVIDEYYHWLSTNTPQKQAVDPWQNPIQIATPFNATNIYFTNNLFISSNPIYLMNGLVTNYFTNYYGR